MMFKDVGNEDLLIYIYIYIYIYILTNVNIEFTWIVD
jgi:hypothetical protein